MFSMDCVVVDGAEVEDDKIVGLGEETETEDWTVFEVVDVPEWA